MHKCDFQLFNGLQKNPRVETAAVGVSQFQDIHLHLEFIVQNVHALFLRKYSALLIKHVFDD